MSVGKVSTAVDLVILGAGPGGYTAAIRAAQLGKNVAIIEPHLLGGTCLNEGCIPSKVLLMAVDRAWRLRGLSKMGIEISSSRVNLVKMQQWKGNIIRLLTDGVDRLLKNHNIAVIPGFGRFADSSTVRVQGSNGEQTITFKRAIIAVGTRPGPLLGLPFDQEHVLTAQQALKLDHLPEQMAIIGWNYIAAELSTLFAKLGVSVWLLVPAGRRLIGEFDVAVGRHIETQLRKLGVKTEHEVTNLPVAVSGVSKVVVCTGAVPNTAELNLEAVGVATDPRGYIPVNDRLESSNPLIYAVGDVNGGLPLASLAFKQGKIAAEASVGRRVHYAAQAVPLVAWTDPEIASVGLTPADAEAAGYAIKTTRFPIGASGRAVTLNASGGLVVTVAEKETQILLGVTIVGPHAGEFIGEAALAIEMGATLLDLVDTLHPHPSLGEALQDSAEAALMKAIHIL
jgi:dihydrolipoamide dehydrogenase